MGDMADYDRSQYLDGIATGEICFRCSHDARWCNCDDPKSRKVGRRIEYQCRACKQWTADDSGLCLDCGLKQVDLLFNDYGDS